MTQLKRDLQSVVKNLRVLAQKTERMAKKLAKLEKAQASKLRKAKTKAPKRRKAKAMARPKKGRLVRRATKATAIDTVLNIIQKRKRGITTDEIKAKTGYKEKKIWDIVNRAKRQGKVKSLGKGVYAKKGA
ncbi:MAG: hypothetical protein QGG48_02035 [Desulfatiglandales bacterium]|jgi:hypothetical protein|nr:hypothetical protein [Desulfatiglandales bacterium]